MHAGGVRGEQVSPGVWQRVFPWVRNSKADVLPWITHFTSLRLSIKHCYLRLLRHWSCPCFYTPSAVLGLCDLLPDKNSLCWCSTKRCHWLANGQGSATLGKRVVKFWRASGQQVKKSEGSLTVLRLACGSEAAWSVASLIKAVPLMQSPIPINHRPCLEQLAKLLALHSWLQAWKWDERRCIIYEARAGKVPLTGLWLARSSWPSQQFSSSTPLPLLEFEPL